MLLFLDELLLLDEELLEPDDLLLFILDDVAADLVDWLTVGLLLLVESVLKVCTVNWLSRNPYCNRRF